MESMVQAKGHVRLIGGANSLQRYRENPVVLFAHDTSRRVGRAAAAEFGERGGVEITIEVVPGQGELLRQWAAGALVLDARYLPSLGEILEFSFVSNPSGMYGQDTVYWIRA